MVSFAFSLGRLIGLYRLLTDNFPESYAGDKYVIEAAYLKNISTSPETFRNTQLFKILSSNDQKVIKNRLNRILKEFTPYTGSVASHEVDLGFSQEIRDAKNAFEFAKAMQGLTSRQIAEKLKINDTVVREILAHKRDTPIDLLQKAQKLKE
jgi:hypothetical protein